MSSAPKGCLSGHCRSPLACSGWGYCRQRDVVESPPPQPPGPNAVVEVLTELLRLYDWRNELAGAVKEGRQTEADQRGDLLRYGREKKAAWEAARAALSSLGTL